MDDENEKKLNRWEIRDAATEAREVERHAVLMQSELLRQDLMKAEIARFTTYEKDVVSAIAHRTALEVEWAKNTDALVRIANAIEKHATK
jgi:hypothetical protein